MVDNNSNDDNNVASTNSIQENLFQAISSMVLNIVQTSMTAPKQFAGGNTWNISPLSDVSKQIPITKHEGTVRKSAINKYKSAVYRNIYYNV